jgi:hypothetical protein
MFPEYRGRGENRSSILRGDPSGVLLNRQDSDTIKTFSVSSGTKVVQILTQILTQNRNGNSGGVGNIPQLVGREGDEVVGDTGLEPVTSCV